MGLEELWWDVTSVMREMDLTDEEVKVEDK